ncbi:MAG: hypothetical protein ABIS45_09565, partial [Burkholderiales bacterium]
MLTDSLALVSVTKRVQNPGVLVFAIVALLACAWALLDAPAEANYAAGALLRENSTPATPTRAVVAPSVVAIVSAPSISRAAPSDWMAGVEKLAITPKYSPGIIRAQSAPALTQATQGIAVAAGNVRTAIMPAAGAA